jgi:hypothetical protein
MLASTGREDVILPVVQLFRVTLKPRLIALVLVALARSLVIATTGPLKTRIRRTGPLEAGTREVPL